MPRTLRFHLDENCDPRIATGLRLRGVDVTTTIEVGLLEASDDEQLAYARDQERVIITEDADFLRMSAAGRASPGVIFVRSQHRSIGRVIRNVLLIWEICEQDEMRNRVEFI